MREIKLRAWDKKEKKMHYGNMEMFDDMIGFRFGHFGVDTSKEDIKLMQSTGLKDENGTEIYEGDIVRNNIDFHYHKIEFIDKHWHGFCFVDIKTNECNNLYEFDNIEVIGNIYDNPGLLEGVE